ncbi:4-oxalocrotonate tautomerase [Alkalibacterium psychrotolerans]
MPIVHVDMLEGRSKDQKENLIKDMVKAVETHTGAPKEAVTVIINEIKKENIATKGNYHG